MRKDNFHVTIVIPVFHEEAVIQSTIEQIEKTVKTKHRFLVVAENERDPTIAVILKMPSELTQNLTLIKNKYKPGIPGSMKTAFEAVKTETVVVIAADLTDAPHYVDAMYEKIRSGYDIVSASRYSGGGTYLAKRDAKYYLSKWANWLSPTLLSISTSDLTYAYKMYRTEVVQTIPIEATGGFEYAMELTIKAARRGMKIGEIPARSVERQVGESKFRLWKWSRQYLRWFLWGMYLRLRNLWRG